MKLGSTIETELTVVYQKSLKMFAPHHSLLWPFWNVNTVALHVERDTVVQFLRPLHIFFYS